MLRSIGPTKLSMGHSTRDFESCRRCSAAKVIDAMNIRKLRTPIAVFVIVTVTGISIGLTRTLSVARADNPTPVNVTVTPTVALPGTAVTIKGSTGIDVAANPQVKLTITPPSGPPVTLAAATTKEGNFSATFSQTKAIGKYSVKAISPGGKGEATITFSIAPPSGAFQEYDGELNQLTPVAEKGLDRAKEILAELPDS